MLLSVIGWDTNGWSEGHVLLTPLFPAGYFILSEDVLVCHRLSCRQGSHRQVAWFYNVLSAAPSQFLFRLSYDLHTDAESEVGLCDLPSVLNGFILWQFCCFWRLLIIQNREHSMNLKILRRATFCMTQLWPGVWLVSRIMFFGLGCLTH